MEPAATSFLVARDPPPAKMAHLGQGPAPSGWARQAFTETVYLLLAGAFAWGLRSAGYDLGFAVTTTYALAALCCLWKLELLRRDGGGDPASAARGRRLVGLATCAVSLSLACTVASVAPSLALYFTFVALSGGARAEAAGRCPEKDLHELSPEQRV